MTNIERLTVLEQRLYGGFLHFLLFEAVLKWALPVWLLGVAVGIATDSETLRTAAIRLAVTLVFAPIYGGWLWRQTVRKVGMLRRTLGSITATHSVSY